MIELESARELIHEAVAASEAGDVLAEEAALRRAAELAVSELEARATRLS
jgi:hypothetical protein